IYGEFFVYMNTGLSTIQQGEIIDSFRAIREDIIKTAFAAYIAELTNKLIESRKQVPYLYNQFKGTLQWISRHNEAEIPIMMYEIKLFEEGGFSPIVSNCANCGSTTPPYSFSISEGGFLCTSCLFIDDRAIPLP